MTSAQDTAADPPALVEALAHYRLGHYAEALEALAGDAASFPSNIRFIRLQSRIEDRLGNLETAARLLDQVLELAPDHAPSLYERGVVSLRIDHQQLSGAATAERFLVRAIAADPRHAEAHFNLGVALQMQARAEEAIPQYEAAIALAPHLAKSYYELAKLYNDTKQYDAAKLALEKTLDLQPDHLNAANDLQELRRSLRVLSRGMEIVRFPNRLDTFADMKSAIKDHVLGKDYPNILSRSSKIATFGSCFAGNIARALREIGMDARNTTFGESINSTPANRQYVDWVMDGVENEATRAIIHFHAGDPNFSMDREEHVRRFAESDLIVMTVGVAPCFFDRNDGTLVIPRPTSFGLRGLLHRCEFRTTNVAENVDNLSYIISKIRSLNDRCSIIVTLSPVPLTATFEYHSAVVADTVSKSTLRVAIDELLRRKYDKVYYWPSFEVVRWLGAYAPGMYGQEDGSTIHVSEEVIAMQMSLFIEVLSGGMIVQ